MNYSIILKAITLITIIVDCAPSSRSSYQSSTPPASSGASRMKTISHPSPIATWCTHSRPLPFTAGKPLHQSQVIMKTMDRFLFPHYKCFEFCDPLKSVTPGGAVHIFCNMHEVEA